MNGVPNQELTRQSDRVIERLRFTPPWHNAWFLDDLYDMSPVERRGIIDALLGDMSWKEPLIICSKSELTDAVYNVLRLE